MWGQRVHSTDVYAGSNRAEVVTALARSTEQLRGGGDCPSALHGAIARRWQGAWGAPYLPIPAAANEHLKPAPVVHLPHHQAQARHQDHANGGHELSVPGAVSTHEHGTLLGVAWLGQPHQVVTAPIRHLRAPQNGGKCCGWVGWMGGWEMQEQHELRGVVGTTQGTQGSDCVRKEQHKDTRKR